MVQSSAGRSEQRDEMTQVSGTSFIDTIQVLEFYHRFLLPLYFFRSSFSELTMISVLWSEAQSRLGSIVARVDISSFDLLFGFQWTSCHLDSPIWRTTKSKLFTKKHQRWKHHADPVLPGFDLPSTRQTRMTIAMNFGIASGVELKVRKH